MTRLTSDGWYAILNLSGGGDASHTQHLKQMNFWTPERCKTIPTLQLMENSREMSSQAAVIKNRELAERKTTIVQMIQSELRRRHSNGSLFGKDGYGN
tara:strand:+ start:213 stop:506 length:294 start_codon:yes stop_codon:yes gene_type:complete